MDREDSISEDARVFRVDGKGWYFYAREGVIGPMASYARALQYLDRLKNFSDDQRPDVWGQDQRKQHRVERLAVGNSGPRRLTKSELREVVAYLERKVANKSDTLDVDQIRLRYCRKLLYQQSDE